MCIEINEESLFEKKRSLRSTRKSAQERGKKFEEKYRESLDAKIAHFQFLMELDKRLKQIDAAINRNKGNTCADRNRPKRTATRRSGAIHLSVKNAFDFTSAKRRTESVTKDEQSDEGTPKLKRARLN